MKLNLSVTLIINKIKKKRDMEKVGNMFSMEVAKTMIKTENGNRKTMMIVGGIIFGLFAFIFEGLWFARLMSVGIW